MRGIIIGTIVACAVLIGGAVFFTVNGNKGGGPRIVALHPSYEQRVADGYWKKGAEDPTVTLTEYMDFQCPGCASAVPLVEDVVRETSDFVQFQVRQYPLTNIHDKAMMAAVASEAVGRQGKFWEMYSILFTSQKEWEGQAPATFRTTLESYAESLNINMEQYRRDVRDGQIEDAITRDRTAGNRLQIPGTPSFAINGELVQRPTTVEDFVALLKSKAPAGDSQE
jgi:protein-disulfide isomerase